MPLRCPSTRVTHPSQARRSGFGLGLGLALRQGSTRGARALPLCPSASPFLSPPSNLLLPSGAPPPLAAPSAPPYPSSGWSVSREGWGRRRRDSDPESPTGGREERSRGRAVERRGLGGGEGSGRPSWVRSGLPPVAASPLSIFRSQVFSAGPVSRPPSVPHLLLINRITLLSLSAEDSSRSPDVRPSSTPPRLPLPPPDPEPQPWVLFPYHPASTHFPAWYLFLRITYHLPNYIILKILIV